MATATTFPELFGGVFPSPTLVVEDTLYGPEGDDVIGLLDVTDIAVPDNDIDEPIVIGTDYLAEHGNAFVFTAEDPGLVASECTCLFGGSAAEKGSWLASGALVDLGANTWQLSFDLVAADTSGCLPGCYDWTVEIVSSAGKRIHVAHDEVDLIASETD